MPYLVLSFCAWSISLLKSLSEVKVMSICACGFLPLAVLWNVSLQDVFSPVTMQKDWRLTDRLIHIFELSKFKHTVRVIRRGRAPLFQRSRGSGPAVWKFAIPSGDQHYWILRSCSVRWSALQLHAGRRCIKEVVSACSLNGLAKAGKLPSFSIAGPITQQRVIPRSAYFIANTHNNHSFSIGLRGYVNPSRYHDAGFSFSPIATYRDAAWELGKLALRDSILRIFSAWVHVFL